MGVCTRSWRYISVVHLSGCSHLLHPHIIQFKEVFLTEKHLAVAMEYAAGGDMFQYVKRKGGLEEAEVGFRMHCVRFRCLRLSPDVRHLSDGVSTRRRVGFSSNSSLDWTTATRSPPTQPGAEFTGTAPPMRSLTLWGVFV